MINDSTIFATVSRNRRKCTPLVSIACVIHIFAAHTRLSPTHHVVCLWIARTRLYELIEVSHIERRSPHVDVRHILKLGAYVLHTFSSIIIKHRECNVSVELWFFSRLDRVLVEILACSQLASRSKNALRMIFNTFHSWWLATASEAFAKLTCQVLPAFLF